MKASEAARAAAQWTVDEYRNCGLTQYSVPAISERIQAAIDAEVAAHRPAVVANALARRDAEIAELVEALREFLSMPVPYGACWLPDCRCTFCRFVEWQDEARALLSRYQEKVK